LARKKNGYEQEYYAQFSVKDYMTARYPSGERPMFSDGDSADEPYDGYGAYNGRADADDDARAGYANGAYDRNSEYGQETYRAPEPRTLILPLYREPEESFQNINRLEDPPADGDFYQYTDSRGRSFYLGRGRGAGRRADDGTGEATQPHTCAPEYTRTPPPEREPYRAHPRKRGEHTKGRRSAALLICICLLVAAVSGAALITRKKKSAGVFPQTDYYAVALGAYATLPEAQIRADEVKQMGGAGYIVEDSRYLVLAFAYASAADCDGVIARLAETGTAGEKRVIPLARRDFGSKACADAARAAITAFDTLYTCAVKLDTGENTETDARNRLNALVRFCDEQKNALSPYPPEARLKNLFASLSSELSAVSVMNGGALLRARIKYCALDLLFGLSSVLSEG